MLQRTPVNIQVTWDKPANGACVDNYSVDVRPKIQPRSGLGAKPPQKTPNFELVIEGLSAGTVYMVNVQVRCCCFGMLCYLTSHAPSSLG